MIDHDFKDADFSTGEVFLIYVWNSLYLKTLIFFLATVLIGETVNISAANDSIFTVLKHLNMIR